MTISILHAIDLLLWFFMAISVAYVAFFAFVCLVKSRKKEAVSSDTPFRYLVLYPAYNEDNVIRLSVETFLQQDYPRSNYELAVISDHMQPATNQWLSAQPITLFQPVFEKSSKAKALQYAMREVASKGKTFDYVVILDADNVVGKDFLIRLNEVCHAGHQAIQCHRTAKNSDGDIAALDGASEEINNTIFRYAHNLIGLSSALIGSGMCFDFHWFQDNVNQLSTAGEDRELEAMLLRQRIHIHYADHIYVMDEKVSSGDNFQRQRLRWMTAQIQCLLAMLPYLPKAIATGNINYIDKTLQQALIPRSILLVIITLLSLLMLLLQPAWSLKWWLLLGILGLSLIIAIPRRLRSRTLFGNALLIPQLVLRMLGNIAHIDTHNKDFIHTTHDK
jgi:cellulose synthase/poly-beta-1,6-N-acetylglucosamine synthase-like glycosyltransferase